jgi:hypothetical protein
MEHNRVSSGAMRALEQLLLSPSTATLSTRMLPVLRTAAGQVALAPAGRNKESSTWLVGPVRGCLMQNATEGCTR